MPVSPTNTATREPLPTATSTVVVENTETAITITGVVVDVSFSARLIMLKESVKGIRIIALTENCEIKSSTGEKLDLRDIQPGMSVQASGQPGASEALLTSFVLAP